MTIQIPDAGTGNGATGDNEFVLWTKVINNFSDQTNAASKLVGTAAGQVPLAEDTFKAAYTLKPPIHEDGAAVNADSFSAGTVNLLRLSLIPALAEIFAGEPYVTIRTYLVYNATNLMQTAQGYSTGAFAVRVFNGEWSAWQPTCTSIKTYNTTTASGANVVVDATGSLMRSTSSERYKNILAPLELDDARYADAMALKPIVYRSTADADNPLHHFYSFSAEELGAYDPAFTLWRTTEVVTDEDGNTTEQPLAVRQAEGININALLAMGHAIAIKQGDLIKDLQEQINALKPQSEV